MITSISVFSAIRCLEYCILYYYLSMKISKNICSTISTPKNSINKTLVTAKNIVWSEKNKNKNMKFMEI